MLKKEQIQHLLQDKNLAEVSRGTGIHYNTVYRVANGGKPDYDVAARLSSYLLGEEA